MNHSLRKYVLTLIEAAGWQLAVSVAIAAACSLTEGVGIILLIPTLQATGLNLAGQGQVGRYAELISRVFRAAKISPTLPVLLAIFVVLISTRALMVRFESVSTSSVALKMERYLRERLYQSFTNANWLFLCRKKSSDLIHALTAEIDRVGSATFYTQLLASDALVTVIYALIALALAPWVTVLVLTAGLFLVILLRGRTRALHQAGSQISNANQRLYGAAIDHVQGLKAVKTYGAEESDCRVFTQLSERLAAAGQEAARRQALTSWWFESGSVAILSAAIYVSIAALAVAPAAILILLFVFARLMPRLMSAHEHYRGILNELPAFATTLALEEECRAAAEPRVSSHEPVELRQRLELRNVSFGYEAGQRSVIRNLDLEISVGQAVAIGGPSGSGKSTLADIVMGLLTPESGELVIDGIVLDKSRVGEWRKRIGYVSADTLLFYGTIRSNLLWADPGATDEEIWTALRLAAADDFVRRLPDQLETPVGDRGALFSQGERQRIALARALLRKPSLLVLDEATNSLDYENEARVLGAIDRLRRSLAILIIAHRDSTIEWADAVYLLEDGNLTERKLATPTANFRVLRAR